MQTQSKSWPLVLAILIAALMLCATLLVLNLRRTYPFVDTTNNKLLIDNTVYLRLLSSGCTTVPTPAGGVAAVSCPLWVSP
jgi:hypothetical protein